MGNNKNVKHIALQVNENDLKDFYQNILKGEIIGETKLNEDIANKIFGIKTTVKIIFIEVEGFEFELFIYNNYVTKQFSHICLETDEAKEMFQQALKAGYCTNKLQNEFKVTYFIEDRNGNLFELKNKIKE